MSWLYTDRHRLFWNFLFTYIPRVESEEKIFCAIFTEKIGIKTINTIYKLSINGGPRGNGETDSTNFFLTNVHTEFIFFLIRLFIIYIGTYIDHDSQRSQLIIFQGFETRGTDISRRLTAWENLLDSVSHVGPLTTNPLEAKGMLSRSKRSAKNPKSAKKNQQQQQEQNLPSPRILPQQQVRWYSIH